MFDSWKPKSESFALRVSHAKTRRREEGKKKTWSFAIFASSRAMLLEANFKCLWIDVSGRTKKPGSGSGVATGPPHRETRNPLTRTIRAPSAQPGRESNRRKSMTAVRSKLWSAVVVLAMAVLPLSAQD